ncbi:MAG: hypothetical protein Q4E03_00025 [Trueperella sp.]|nr:hypothetical protein [Trueperella sp.]
MGNPVAEGVAVAFSAMTLLALGGNIFGPLTTTDSGKKYAVTRISTTLSLYGLAGIFYTTLFWIAPWDLPSLATLLLRALGTLLFIALTLWIVQKIFRYWATLHNGTRKSRGELIGYRIDNHEAGNLCTLTIRIDGAAEQYDVARELYLQVREHIPELPHYANIIGITEGRLPQPYPVLVEFYPGWTTLKDVTLYGNQNSR